MSADLTEEDLLQIEVALRDSRHIDVIMALDRLVMLPHSFNDFVEAKRDLLRVKDFFDKHLPAYCSAAAISVFREHGSLIEKLYLDWKSENEGVKAK